MPCSTFWCKTQIQTFTTTWCLMPWSSSSTSSPTANTTSSGPCWMSILKRTSLQRSPTSESLWAYQKLFFKTLTLKLVCVLWSVVQNIGHITTKLKLMVVWKHLLHRQYLWHHKSIFQKPVLKYYEIISQFCILKLVVPLKFYIDNGWVQIPYMWHRRFPVLYFQ